MFRALILIDDTLVADSIHLKAVAEQLADEEEVETYGLSFDPNQKVTGIDVLLQVDTPALQKVDSRQITDIVEQLNETYSFDSIVVLATDFGRMLAPRIAMRLKTGLVADITGVEVDKRGKKMVRPAFSGNILASIVCETKPIMASVHPNVFHAENIAKEPVVEIIRAEKMKASSIIVITDTSVERSEDIREAAVLVSAGGGFDAPIHQLEPLADQLSGNIAVSKPLVDQGRAPREIQVGQSGKTVSPNLYLALGIYGSMQHVEGLKNVKEIISVNTDLGAPMNYLADLVVHDDAAEFSKKLIEKLG